MRISGPGRARAEAGFSLLEIMMVLLIIGIATSLASLAAFGPDGARALRQDAQRLAQIFELAQAQARSSGQLIVWQPDAKGYLFSPVPRRLLLPAHMVARAPAGAEQRLDGDSPLRARRWLSGAEVKVSMEPAGPLVFGLDWITDPLEIELYAAGRVQRLVRLRDGRFKVLP